MTNRKIYDDIQNKLASVSYTIPSPTHLNSTIYNTHNNDTSISSENNGNDISSRMSKQFMVIL